MGDRPPLTPRFRQRNPEARAEAVSGFVRNLPDGRVEFEIGGDVDAVARLLEKIRRGPDYARVSDVQLQELQPAVASGAKRALELGLLEDDGRVWRATERGFQP